MASRLVRLQQDISEIAELIERREEPSSEEAVAR
jgi:hypothetical protein